MAPSVESSKTPDPARAVAVATNRVPVQTTCPNWTPAISCASAAACQGPKVPAVAGVALGTATDGAGPLGTAEPIGLGLADAVVGDGLVEATGLDGFDGATHPTRRLGSTSEVAATSIAVRRLGMTVLFGYDARLMVTERTLQPAPCDRLLSAP